MGSETKVLVPDIGDFSGVEVIEILVSEGDQIEQEASLVTVESDKATMEIPSPQAGTVKSLLVNMGDSISEGDALLVLEVAEASEATGDEDADSSEAVVETTLEPVASAPSEPDQLPERRGRRHGEKAVQQPPVLTRPSDRLETKVHASPSVRKFARELGADIHRITGTGPKSRITQDDVKAFIQRSLSAGDGDVSARRGAAIPPLPDVDFSNFGEVEAVELSRIKKLSGAHLSACWLNIPHVTQFDEADITELEAFRQSEKSAAADQGIKLTFMPFLMKACVGVLQALPHFNSSLSVDQTKLIYKRYYNIGVAVDTPNGLVVPVIRDVERKGILELAEELSEVSVRARDGKLSPTDLQGGCFSISSLGGIGGTAFTPIVNGPEVAILGVSRSSMKPVWDGAAFQPRLMLPLSLSYDHRVIDGAQAAHFTVLLGQFLTDVRKLLL